MQSCRHAFVISCIHPFIPSFLPSFIHSFTHSFIHPSIHSFIQSFIQSFIHSCMHACIHSFTHSLIHSFIHSFNLLMGAACVGGNHCWCCHHIFTATHFSAIYFISPSHNLEVRYCFFVAMKCAPMPRTEFARKGGETKLMRSVKKIIQSIQLQNFQNNAPTNVVNKRDCK